MSYLFQIRNIRRSIFVFFTLIFLVSSCSSVKQTASKSDPSAIEQRIQRIQNGLVPPVIFEGETPKKIRLLDRMEELGIPAVSIAVIHDGKIEWARGFGSLKIGGPPVTPDTLFQAGSISKPVAAMAALKLVESGKMDLDADINQYLSSWKVPASNFTDKEKVTLKRLLSHTTGMTVHGFTGYATDEQVPSLLQVLKGEKPANTSPIVVDTVPGTIWRYSGGGYEVMQLALQDVTGKPFPELLQELVLGPAGMTQSTYEQPLPQDRLAQAAVPYQQGKVPVRGGAHIYPEMAAAGLWTTPSDLARFAINLQETLSGKSKGVLSREMAVRMTTNVMNNNGLGLELGGSEPNPYFSHGGSNAGFRNDFVAYHNGDGAVIMTNSDTGGTIINDILRAIANEYGWPDFKSTVRKKITVSTNILNQYTGVYQLAPNFNLMITLEGDQLISQVTGQGKVPIFAETETKFYPKVVAATIEFYKDNKGAVSHLKRTRAGREILARRAGYIKEPDPVDGTWTATVDGADGKPVELTYVFEKLGTTLLGTVNSSLGGGPFSEGKIDGNKISFIVRTDPTTTIETTGVIFGDVINITQRKGNEVKEFTAKRVRENKIFDGTWEGTLPGPDGTPQHMTFEFESTGKYLSGNYSSKLGEGSFSGGKVEGNNISFFLQATEITIYMNGTLSGDVINMTKKKGDEVSQFTLKRVRENKIFDGTWKGTVPGPDGNLLVITYEFESVGNNLSGYVSTELGGGPFSGGKIEGNNISFSVPRAEDIVYVNGTLSGDVINMVQKKGDEVKEFTLERVKENKNFDGTWEGTVPDQAQKIEEGKRMWEKWIAARGGHDRLSKIKEIKSTSEMMLQGINSAVTHYFKGTDKYRVDEKVMGRTSIRVVDGDKGWMTDENTGLSIDMPERARDQFLSEKEKHEELLNPEQFGHTITYEGRKTVDGKEYILLKQATGNGVITIHYIDPDTFLRYKFTLSLFPGLEIITSDYRDVDGTKVPFSTLMLRNGIEVGTRTVVEYLYDCGLDDSLFAKP